MGAAIVSSLSSSQTRGPPCDLTATLPAPSSLLPPGKEGLKDSGQSPRKGWGRGRGKKREKEEDVRKSSGRDWTLLIHLVGGSGAPVFTAWGSFLSL